ncbi:hypothetical protein NDU88_010295 [Pleurodeles waltl]|uniref:Secreted protein n=1 Tax=Pleurodeles waltl TaxID=8319 RepID=A0AAV7PYA5_PLEWA|nr:hypothetical protein NDU88_010295 [Pleurodeles waltl]
MFLTRQTDGILGRSAARVFFSGNKLRICLAAISALCGMLSVEAAGSLKRSSDTCLSASPPPVFPSLDGVHVHAWVALCLPVQGFPASFPSIDDSFGACRWVRGMKNAGSWTGSRIRLDFNPFDPLLVTLHGVTEMTGRALQSCLASVDHLCTALRLLAGKNIRKVVPLSTCLQYRACVTCTSTAQPRFRFRLNMGVLYLHPKVNSSTRVVNARKHTRTHTL